MNTESGYFTFLIIISLIPIIIFIVGIILYLKTHRNANDWLYTSAVIGALVAIFAWGVGACSADSRYSYEEINSSRVEVFKTPVLYIVQVDKETVWKLTSLEECRAFDQKDSLYFHIKRSYDFYDNLNYAIYIWSLKPISKKERKEN